MNVWKKSTVPNLFKNVATGMYYARFSCPVNGKSKQMWRALGTDDIAQAKDRLPDVIRATRDECAVVVDRNISTVGDAFDRLAGQRFSLSSRDVKPGTITYYTERAAALFRSWPGLKDKTLPSLTPGECLRWANSYDGSPSSFNGTLMVFKLAVKLALQGGSIKSDPLACVKRKRIKRKAPELPTRQQFADVLRVMGCAVHPAARASRNLVRLMAFSGTRLGEAHGLRWRDVDFNRGMVHIEHQLSPDGKLVSPKNGEDRRVPMNSALRDTLVEMRNDAAKCGRAAPDDRITQVDKCRAALSHACKVVGCAQITHHHLRHFFITSCVEAGVDFKTIASWVGHRDGGVLIGTTYAHLRPEHSQAMAAKVTFTDAAPVVEPMPVAAAM